MKILTTKIDKIFTVKLTLCKGQIISKGLFGNWYPQILPKNEQSNSLLYLVKTNSFVRFSWEFKETKSPFHIIWPLVSVKLTAKILSIFVVFLENMNFTYRCSLYPLQPSFTFGFNCSRAFLISSLSLIWTDFCYRGQWSFTICKSPYWPSNICCILFIFGLYFEIPKYHFFSFFNN